MSLGQIWATLDTMCDLVRTHLQTRPVRRNEANPIREKSMPGSKGSSSGRSLLFLLLIILSFTTMVVAQVQGPTVRRDVHHDVSPPLRDLIKLAPPPSLVKHEAEPVRRIPLPPGLSQLEEDPIRQKTIAPLTPLVSQS